MRLLTTQQVATRLQLSPDTLADWRWKRIGPPFLRISRGCIRYDEATLDLWISTQTIREIPRSA